MLRYPIGRTVRYRIFSPLTVRSMSSNNCGIVSKANVRACTDPSLADQPISLWVEGLQAKQKVTLHASTKLPNGRVFDTISHYIANESGSISLDRDVSHGGSFTGVCPMGPLSFMTGSIVNERKYERFLIKDPTRPFTVDFRVLDSFLEDLDVASSKALFLTPPNSSITRFYMAPGVTEHTVWEGRIRGTLYLPPGNGPFPGVISMSGGYPGAMKYKAALLASHGFAAIALKYFGEDDLPQEFFVVDIDYFEEAANFLKAHPKVKGKRGIGIVANCYGATIALALASFGPKGLVRSVASTSGWCFRFGKFSYKGKNIPTKLSPSMEIKRFPSGIVEWKYTFPSNVKNQDEVLAGDACFAFHERHETAFMLVAGGEDGYVQGAVEDVVQLHENALRSSKHPNYEILFYPKAGHLIEHSFYPFCVTVWTFGDPHNVGGKQPDHSEAQIDSWPKILEFTRRNLRDDIPPAKL